MVKERLLVVCGPTATGKSKLAIEIAQKYNGVIISMDSMQIYKFMDIGTAKPNEQDKKNIKHEMIDIIDPKENFSVSDYVKNAEEIISSINKDQKLPILTGGTGLYLKALLNEYSLGNIAANVELRKELYEIAKKENGKLTLHNLLHQVDPQTASRLHVNDIRRVIRAIEVFKTTGVSISSQTQTTNNKYNLLLLGLYEDRSFLYKKIEDRVEIMFDRGLVDEVKWLIKYGVNTNAQSLKGIGYKEILPYLYGEHDLDTTKYNIKINTRRYAKRQITFFKSFDNIDWINKNEENCYFNSANEKIIKWMQTND